MLEKGTFKFLRLQMFCEQLFWIGYDWLPYQLKSYPYDGNINLAFLPEYVHMINLTVQSMSITFPGIYLNIIVSWKVLSFGSDS